MNLKRKLGFWAVFCIATGAMISSGLFVLPGLAFKQAGPAVILAYALAAILVIPALLSKAELSTAMPRSGGSYFFVERSMGALPGTLAGLANWLGIALKSAFALIGIGAFARLILPGTSDMLIKTIAIGCCLIFTVLNILSVKGAGRVQIVLVAVLLAVLGVFVCLGMPKVQHANFANFMGSGMSGVFATAGLVFVSFGGLTKVASIAGEIRRPGRNIPAAMISSYVVVSLLYVVAVFVTVGLTTGEELSTSLTPLSLAAGKFLGPGGVVLLAVAGMLAFVTTANSGILAASRSPMAMSRDGLLPGFLQKISSRFGTPYVSIILTAAFMIAVITLLSIENLVKVASTMMLMLFAMVNVAVLVMRGSKMQNYRPLFRAPLYPWIQLAGIILYAVLIAGMGAVPLLTTGGFLAAGVLWYLFYVRTRISRESAFVYMVRNIVSKDIYRSELEAELREIALERDEVVRDRFDHLIRQCAVLDIKGPVSSDGMFREVAGALAPRLGIDEQKLFELFGAREAQSSTVVQPGLAIPHIVLEGQKLFDIVLLRCKEGIEFSGQTEPVRTVFILVGSRDERNYHLRALMAVAHIVQEHDFARRWLEAPQAEHLRDIVLLSGRQRDGHWPGG